MPSKQNIFLKETVGLQPFDAIQLHHYIRIQYFLRNGLDPDLRDRQQRTLLMSASNLVEDKTAVKFTNLLLKYKARIELKDVNGLNALHYAVLNEHRNLVERLLEFAGDFNINTRDSFGNTALMLAVFTRNYDIVRSIVHKLRKYGLSVDIRNSEGVTPVILATSMHQNKIAKFLVEFGKASGEIREKPRRQSDRKHDTAPMYINALNGCSVYITIGKHLIGRNPSTYQDKLEECSNILTGHPTLKRAVLQDSSKHVNYPPQIIRDSLPKLYSTEKPSISSKYQYIDLKPVYNLYEQELSPSYRKSVPLRIKTHSSSDENQNLWQKTMLKQRRHTIALSHSLSNNISTKNIFEPIIMQRQARSYSLGTNEKFKACALRENTRRNSVPATAPGGLETNHRRSSISKEMRPQRRLSVSFQSAYDTPREENSPCNTNEENNHIPGEPTIPEEECL